MTDQYVLDLREVSGTNITLVGGKGANLGELSRIDGVTVPAGFCVTTEAFRRAEDHRREIEAAIAGRIRADTSYAVRSSATAEDTPTASFAGQHDTYLGVVGAEAVLEGVRRCWESLFTERAVAYRRRNGFDDSRVHMAVVVQEMVPAEASGVLFTADPITGDRRVSAVDAVFGLGEALVSGLVNPDGFKVRDGVVVGRAIAAERPALTDEQVVRLVALGRRIEEHFGRPQDIEWCLTGDDFQIVQSRPITTLYPVPAAAGDGGNHVYVSVGHQQMMTDAMRPLGWSMWQLTAMAPMIEAGGRLWVDATRNLTNPAIRDGFLEMLGKAEPLVRDALETLLDRDGYLPAGPAVGPGKPPPGWQPPVPLETDPAIVTGLIESSQASIEQLRQDISGKTGTDLFGFLLEAFEEHKRMLRDPVSIQAIMAGMDATWWLNEKLLDWLGEKNAADTLTLSAPGNITSEMGLALLDVADVIRPHPEVVAFLRGVDGDFLDELGKLPGGAEAREAITGYLDRYGMRCVGEIDITRPRWSEQPATLVPLILDNVRMFEPGAGVRRFEQGRQTALAKRDELLQRLREQPDGEERAAETERMIDRVRTFIGYREYPKYAIICRYFLYKQALTGEAGRLVRAGVLETAEDAYYLTFQELHDVVRTERLDSGLIRQRREQFRTYQALTPPRVLTSDGEALDGAYRRDDAPAGALVGLPVSAGTVEGRARVILDMADADLEPGDILVTAFTDPSWSPLFVAIAGLVTEVGGLMTHGAVIAREYGLPAVVGVVGATRTIADGQRIRVNATDGHVELLS
ncbi:putative phosphoenolpyruvate synthase [Actinoplanes italicus]|uniref:Pyruvate,water dikinase n=1 Tax=Actinoplanes italicus TaxID=113567 RepID=A0A2T0K5R1_9ACTN|nr:rifamycin-inactivating phosphotransferase [Actinoplanes italicus]PRX18322.1 pyruvate,water dikinase [Actinoplanes italicus]GIE32730.1 putative phosphoenolpyruvate synthase [Actinoplanes italicus]